MCDGDLGRNVSVKREIQDSTEKSKKTWANLDSYCSATAAAVSLSFTDQFVTVSATDLLKRSHDGRDL